MQQKFTLGKNEKLKSRKQIDQLFRQGKSFSHFPLRILYSNNLNDPFAIRVAFSVSSRNFKKAVDRNKIKRLMQEAYRQQKNSLKEPLENYSKSVSLFIIYTDKRLPVFQEMMEKMSEALTQLIKKIS